MTDSRPEASATAATTQPKIAEKLIHVAWMAVLLGVVIELVIVTLLALGGTLPSASAYFVNVAQKITWSTVVCGALAIGTTAAKQRGPTMGLLGLLGAPLAFTIARATQKALAEVLKVAAPAAALAPLVGLALIKALQYGALGLLIGRLSRKGGGTLKHYLGYGALAGVIFGLATLVLVKQIALTPPSAVDLMARGISEILHPIGCALILWAADVIAKKL
jgi:hypothetical protein